MKSITEQKIFRRGAYAFLYLSLSIGSIQAYADNLNNLRGTTSIEQNTRTYTGVVKDTDGEPLIGATVMIKGTSIGTVTDIDGNYSLKSVGEKDILVFSYIGYLSQELTPKVKNEPINVMLKVDAIGMEEVVVTGYTSMKRKDLAGSVASISADKIARIPSYNITSSLVGVAGIRMDGNSIRIRGTRSKNASNDPLIILDGVPYNETLTSINPGDVESIDVLKDASSTAIYGARGANGVILITTKQAKKGQTIVSYDGFVGVGVNNEGSFDIMNADEYVAYKREAYKAAGTWASEEDDPKVFTGGEIANMGKVDTDWSGDYFNKKRIWTNHAVTIANNKDKTQYKVSFNYKNDNSRTQNAGTDYLYLTTDLTHQVLPFLKMGISNRINYTNSRSKPDIFMSLGSMSPLTKVYNEDGTLNRFPLGDPLTKNPYVNEDDKYYKDKTEEWKVFLRFFAEIKLSKNFTYNTNFSYNPSFSARGYYYDGRSTATQDDTNTAGVHNNRKASWAWNNVLNYTLNIKKHALALTGVFEMQNIETVNSSMSGKGQESPAYLWYNMDRLIDSKSLSTGFVRTQMLSYIGRAQYTYNDRYTIIGSVRSDGASQLAPGNKWALFPSISAAWRMSEENFIKSLPWISNLKLRASYGITGNYAIAAYATAGTLGSKFINFYDEGGSIHLPGLEPSTRPAPDLKWERNNMLNLGLDFGVLDNRIYGTIDVYDSKSYDLLYLKTLPYTTGFNRAWTNVGDTRNRGLEATLTFVPVQQKDLNLNVTLSYYRNKEELVALQDPNMKEDISNGLFLGYPVNGVYYDYKNLGIWQTDEADLASIYGQKPGEVKIADLDGNGKIDGKDRTILGTNRPDWVGGIQISGQWKQLDFSVDCYGEFGALGHDSYIASWWGGNAARNNTFKIDYWTPENPSNKYPRPVASQSIQYLGTTGYHKNNYINIRNITIGYTLPQKWMNSVVKKTRFYVTMNDPIRYSQFRNDGGISWWESFYILGANIQF